MNPLHSVPHTRAPYYGSREGHSEASPNSLRSLTEHGTSTLRRSHPRSFAELTPKLRRRHIRSFADSSPNSAPILRRYQPLHHRCCRCCQALFPPIIDKP
ncbi:MAG: hypothetical protein MJE68_14060 [Proteobacteria bacterium]|nr:hypothetical protein [Pseudomonadota bacterium]